MKTFVERLQMLAFDNDLEQADISRASGIDPATVNKWWNGKREPGPKNTKILCKLFGCSYRWLKFGEGSLFEGTERDERIIAKNLIQGGVNGTSHQAKTMTINNDLSQNDDKLTAEELVLIRLIRTKKNPTNICIETIGFVAAKE